MHKSLERGKYYTTIIHGDFSADVHSHGTAKNLYVVDLYGTSEQLTTVVEKSKYLKELDNLFFNPIANAVWDEHNIFESIRKNRIAE